MNTLTKIANEAIESDAQDFMSLAEHDRRYHDNDYRGGPCNVREQMKTGDNSDEALADAQAREAKIYIANKIDRKMVEDAVRDGFEKINAQNSRIYLSEPDKDGVCKLTIWSKAHLVPDDAVSEGQLKALLDGVGYKMTDYALMIEKADTSDPKTNRAKDKRCFVADCIKKNAIKFREDSDAQKIDTVQHLEHRDLDDEAKSALLRKYGVKSVGGQYQSRTAGDSRADRVKRYLGISGDWEGQSNREDAASGEWENRRLAALKKEQDAKREWQRELGITAV